MRMAEAEQEHRHAIDKKIIESDSIAVSRGQWLGFFISALSIGGAIWTALKGVHWSIPVALVGVPLASIVKAFLNSNRRLDSDE